MALDELSTEVKESLKPQRKEAEELFDKWSAVMKEAAITLSNWDTETEQGVRAIDDTAQKQVEFCYLNLLIDIMGHTLPFVSCQLASVLYGATLRIDYLLKLAYQQKEPGAYLATHESRNFGLTSQEQGQLRNCYFQILQILTNR